MPPFPSRSSESAQRSHTRVVRLCDGRCVKDAIHRQPVASRNNRAEFGFGFANVIVDQKQDSLGGNKTRDPAQTVKDFPSQGGVLLDEKTTRTA